MSRVRGLVHRTPVMTSRTLNEMTGAALFFKCENLQKVGAFKFRGATHAVRSLSDQQAARGVVTHSSGNHAAALALAATVRGIPAYIVMPRTAPRVKVEAVQAYGGQITFCEPTQQAREEACARLMRETGAEMVHPYDDDRVIAGQSTAAIELFEDVADLDVVMCPVGGGGLLSGTCLAAHFWSPSTRVIACEPELADDAHESLRIGRPVPQRPPSTVADGLLTSLSPRTFGIISSLVDRIELAAEADILPALRTMLSRTKLLIEPSAAVVLAVLLKRVPDLQGLRIGVILSGGNVELSRVCG